MSCYDYGEIDKYFILSSPILSPTFNIHLLNKLGIEYL